MAKDDVVESKKLLDTLDQWFLSAVSHPTAVEWLKNAQKDFEFREGKQWSSKELSELAERGQPDTVENLISAKINRLLGQYKKQKTKIVFRGRNVQTDEPTANILSDLALHVQQQSQYEFEETECFLDGITSGAGWLEPIIEFDDLYEPSIKIRQEDCLNVYVDPYSKKYDLSDAQYICIAKWVNVSEAKTTYPDKAYQIQGFYSTQGQSGSLSAVDSLRNENYIDSKNQRVRLVEIRWKEKIKKKIGIYSDQMQGNQTIDFTNKSKKEEKTFLTQPGAKILEKIVENVKMAVFCGGMFLEEPKDMPYDYKSFFMIPYYVYRKKNGEPYGIVRGLIDPQTERNKRRSKALHLLLSNRAIIGEGSVRNKDDFRAEMAKPDGIMEVREPDKVQVMNNLDLAEGQFKLLAESENAMDKISGIPIEPDNTGQLRSGIAVARKQANIDVSITPIFENLRRTRLQVGKHIYELIKQYYTEEKAFYVLDDMKQAKAINLTGEHIQTIKEGIYDVIVDEMPDTTTLQDEQFQVIGQFLQSANLPPQMAMAMFPIWIGLSTIRNKQEIVQKFEQMMQPSPILPKMALNINWDALFPEEKAVFAEMFGRKDLAQIEQQLGHDPSFITKAKEGLQKTQIKTQADMQKNQIDPMAQQQEMQQGQDKHIMDMQQSQAVHDMKMAQSAQQHDAKMQQMDEQGVMKMIQEIVKTEMMKQRDAERNTNTT